MTALSEVTAEVREQTIVVTLNVGTEPPDVDGVVPAVGIESVADVALPMRIVDGAREAP